MRKSKEKRACLCNQTPFENKMELFVKLHRFQKGSAAEAAAFRFARSRKNVKKQTPAPNGPSPRATHGPSSRTRPAHSRVEGSNMNPKVGQIRENYSHLSENHPKSMANLERRTLLCPT